MPDFQTIEVPTALLDNAIRFVDVASLTAKRAIDEVSGQRVAIKRAADLATPLVDHMVESGVVPVAQKQAALAMLASHAETMQLLKAAVDKIVEIKKGLAKQAAAENGAAVDEAEAGIGNGEPRWGKGEARHRKDYNSLTSPFVGEKTAAVKESDRPLLALIGK